MKNIFTLMGKEFRSYYFSPIAYIIIAFFLAMCGFFFYINLQETRQATLRYVLSPVAFLTMMIVPLISMRLIAEERKSGTIENLFTAPITTSQVVIAKFLGALVFYTSLLLPTLGYLVLFEVYHGNWPLFPTLTFYLGLLLLASSYLAIGILISSLTDNQIVAAFATFILLLILYLLFLVDRYAPTTTIAQIAQYTSFLSHLSSFEKGVLDTKDFLYHLLNTTFFLFLTIQILEVRRTHSSF